MPTDQPVPGFFFRLTRSLAIGLVGVAVGVVRGLSEGLAAVHAEGYGQLGFDRNRGLELEAAAQRGLEEGFALGRTLAAVAFVVLMLSWVFPPFRLERIIRALRGSIGPAVAVFALALTLIWGLLALAQDRAVRGYAWLEPADVRVAALALTLGGIWIALATLFAAASSGEEERPDPVPRAFLLLGMVLIGGGFWINRTIWTPPADQFVLLRNGVLLAVAVTLFLAEQGRPAAWRLLVTLAFFTSLAPLVVRARAETTPTLEARRPWNVVVIALDTVRADQTSLLSRPGARDTTHNIRLLAERGINYTRAISQAPWTIPSFASILTGKYPHEHGAYVLNSSLPHRNVLLPEVLREAGYETYGVISHLFLQEFRGFRQGYDAYDESPTQVHDMERAVTSGMVTESALTFLRERDAEQPFFLFAHYFDPHYEYRDHPGWDLSDWYDGWFKDQLVFENLLKNGRLLDEHDLAWLVDLYREEVMFTDHHVGRVLKQLEDSGLMENTLVVVVADHGEEFRDHGYFGHTTSLYQEVIHVPLVIAPPRGFDWPAELGADFQGGVEVDQTVETRRVFDTVLDLVGIDWGANGGAHSLARFVDGSAAPGPHRAYSSVWLAGTRPQYGKRFQKAAMVEDDWKVIFDMTRDRTELFDLSLDPGERRELTGPEERRAVAMRAVLDGWIGHMQETAAEIESAEFDPARSQELEGLGYTGADEEEEE
jgi:arylsulfatase A-like enzyme